MAKLLMIEDHGFYCTVLSHILSDYELDIHTALSTVTKPLDYYDIILTDGNHGEGIALGGVAVVKQSGTVPVVAMSNNQEYLDLMVEAGAIGSYFKGIPLLLLKNALTAALEA